MILRRTNESERYELHLKAGFESPFAHPISKCDLLLEVEFEDHVNKLGSGNGTKREKIQNKLQDLIFALQLMSKQFVGIPLISFVPEMGRLSTLALYDYDIKDFYPAKQSILKTENGSFKINEILKYRLTNVELNELENVLNTVKHRSSNGNIRLACDRYESSCRSKSREYKFIDLAISVEALFSREDDIFGTLTHKYSLRLSRFIEDNSIKREKIYQNMKELYMQRSDIMHVRESKHLDLDTLKDYVRRSLRIYLNKLNNDPILVHRNIIDQIDYN
jgi:hypothetical protein